MCSSDLRLGGFSFVNISAQNGYNLNLLADEIVEKALDMGFELPPEADRPAYKFKSKKKSRMHSVTANKDGGYFVTRENSEDGPGMFESFTQEEEKVVDIENIVFDFNDVVFKKRIWELHEKLSTEESLSISKEKLSLAFSAVYEKGFATTELAFFEIGRASWRERVLMPV